MAEFDQSGGRKSATKPLARPGRQLAVAVQDAGSGGARPRVVAKGHGKLAEQILNIAFERGVKVRSDADLAEILSAVDVDCEIPVEALAAVSEILTYVYRASQGTENTAEVLPEDVPDGTESGAGP